VGNNNCNYNTNDASSSYLAAVSNNNNDDDTDDVYCDGAKFDNSGGSTRNLSSNVTTNWNWNWNANRNKNAQRLATSVGAAILSLAIATATPLLPSPVFAQPCHAMTPDQLLVDDVWREVSRQFVDPTFNGQGEAGWSKQRLLALEKSADLGPDDEDTLRLYRVIRGMLQTLNDPYTRFLTPDQFEALTKAYATKSSSSATSTSGIGVQLIGDSNNNNAKTSSTPTSSGMVVVVNTVGKSPAEKAGILPGDKIRSVDGVDMVGATAEVVAAKCRGETGTTVSIELERPSADEGSSTPTSATTTTTMERKIVTVMRTPITPIPVIEASTAILSPTNQKVGIVKINTFTKETEALVRQELKQFSRNDSGSNGENQQQQETAATPPTVIALDLRGNMGGYMPAGVDVAKLFLPPRARIISEVDKTGRATIYINDGIGSETDTSTPLYLIVDKRTASASEILAAALQDNERAKIVSSTSPTEGDRTFCKGRIQNVQALSYGGSGIAVTKARYTTPNGRDIQGVGIAPDLRSNTCTAKDSAAACLDGIL